MADKEQEKPVSPKPKMDLPTLRSLMEQSAADSELLAPQRRLAARICVLVAHVEAEAEVRQADDNEIVVVLRQTRARVDKLEAELGNLRSGFAEVLKTCDQLLAIVNTTSAAALAAASAGGAEDEAKPAGPVVALPAGHVFPAAGALPPAVAVRATPAPTPPTVPPAVPIRPGKASNKAPGNGSGGAGGGAPAPKDEAGDKPAA